MITKTIDSVTFTLKEDFDFSFLSQYGKVFAAFDQQDSGNLCFGVDDGAHKRFLKLAGAATVRSRTPPAEAVRRLKETVPVYQALEHPVLLAMSGHAEIPGGYLTVYPWFQGECMGKQYAARERFLALPLMEKLRIYGAILRFHRYVNERGYVAIDFYDGCIMYDFLSKEVRLCDIEMYREMPYVNEMGRMWGSGRYMSPEEFSLGAALDERTNVFLMGATAFCLMGGETDRSPGLWQAGEAARKVALKAVSADRAERYASIGQYEEAWRKAVAGVSQD